MAIETQVCNEYNNVGRLNLLMGSYSSILWISFYPECVGFSFTFVSMFNLQSRARTHAILVIGLYELLGNPTT
jgi:hypothetical protein